MHVTWSIPAVDVNTPVGAAMEPTTAGVHRHRDPGERAWREDDLHQARQPWENESFHGRLRDECLAQALW